MPAGRIACVYCGGAHATVADVRACWAAHEEAPGPVDAPAGGPVAAVAAGPAGGPVAPGPAVLGRNLVVVEGTTVADAWRACEVIPVDPASLPSGGRLAARLLGLAHARTPAVFRLAGPFRERPAAVERRPPWQLSAGFTFTADLVWHLVWANSVDLTDPAGPRFAPVELALALGARPAGVHGADVVLPDGTPGFCDGGPIRFMTGEELGVPGAAVVHRVALEHGSLAPLATNATRADLAPDQRAAVTHAGGAARIIAPAGSGKTRVLTERARHLLRNWQLPGAGVCLVAFNVRAAAEMRDRTTDLPQLQVRTLNSLALAILNGDRPFRGRGERVRTIEEPEVRKLIDSLVDLPRRASTDPAAAWIEALSVVRLGLRDPSAVEEEYGGDVDGLPDVLPRYRRLLADRGEVDFDEQIYRAIEVLLTEPETRLAAQRACRLLLVDEFQDLTPAHVLLVRLAAGPDAAVFGVGDDDQTIYGYAGASPEWLIGFAEFFPGAGSHALTVNYRCPPAVATAAARLLERNRVRVPKRIHPAPGRAGGDGQLRVLDGGDDPTTAACEHVRALVDGGVAPETIAVLARVNASLAPAQVALARAGVPVRRVLDEAWLQRSGVRAALAWVRLATVPDRLYPADVQLAVRRPPRAVAPRVVEWMAEQRSVGRLRALAGRLTGRDAAKVEGFTDDLERLAAMARSGAPTARLLSAVRDEVGLDQAMQTLEGARRRLDRSAQTDDLDALVALARLHDDAATFEAWLREELGAPGQDDGVSLATVHAVKGREWPHVVVLHATAGLMPHRLAADVEEERRVFHVAITRGVDSVTVVPGEPPSPFVAELSRDPADDPRPRAAAPRPAAAPSQPATAAAPGRGRGRASANPAATERARELLREWRRQRAGKEGRPAYTIFHDTTLDDIATRLPTTLVELLGIKGIGPAKLDQFGDEVLATVARAVED